MKFIDKLINRKIEKINNIIDREVLETVIYKVVDNNQAIRLLYPRIVNFIHNIYRVKIIR